MKSALAARALPFAIFILVLALRGALNEAAAGPPIDPRWLYACQAGLPVLALLFFRHQYFELTAAPGGIGALLPSVRGAIAAAVVGLAVFLLWIALDAPWMRIGSPVAAFVPLKDPSGPASGALNWSLIALRLAGASVVVPPIEELMWRSFLMRWIDRRDFLAAPPGATSGRALLVSSAVFALEHDRWLAGLVAGLAYGQLYRKTGDLRCAVAAHALTNFALGVWVVSTRSWQFW